MQNHSYSLHVISVASQKYDLLAGEGKDPSEYYFLDASDFLGGSRVIKKVAEGEEPSSEMPPDWERYLIIDLAEIPNLRKWLPQGDVCVVGVLQYPYSGEIFSFSKSLKAIASFALSNYLQLIDHRLNEGVRAEWCPPSVVATLATPGKNKVRVKVACDCTLKVQGIDGHHGDLLKEILAGYPLTEEHYYKGSDGRTRQGMGYVVPWEGKPMTINRGAGWESHIEDAKNGRPPYGFPGTAQQFLDIASGKVCRVCGVSLRHNNKSGVCTNDTEARRKRLTRGAHKYRSKKVKMH
jgi:hypothetical protein